MPCRRTDVELAAHLEAQGIEFLQFGFRWVNCLLLREMPLPVVLRLWDTYMAEKASLKEFLVRVGGSAFIYIANARL